MEKDTTCISKIFEYKKITARGAATQIVYSCREIFAPWVSAISQNVAPFEIKFSHVSIIVNYIHGLKQSSVYNTFKDCILLVVIALHSKSNCLFSGWINRRKRQTEISKINDTFV